MPYKKILVATDFSAEARIALNHAINIARLHSAEIILVHACPLLEPPHEIIGHDDWRDSMRMQLAENRADLEALRDEMSGQYAAISHRIVDDLPAAGVVRAAHDLEVDLVVVGTHGRTGLKRFMLGSDSERIIRHSSIDVMLARSSERLVGGYRRILVPTDFSATSEAALRVATGLVANGGDIELRHWWNNPMFGPLPDPSVIGRELKRNAEQRGAALAERYADERYALRFTAAEGYAKYGIQNRLEEDAYDLVVMGSHGRTGAKRLFLGSVAETTARHAPCSVYIVKPRDDPDADEPAEDLAP
jgi:nucleotide-binding universal stress UspA family protein